MKCVDSKFSNYATFGQRLFVLIVSPAFFFVAYDFLFYWPWLVFGDYDENLFYLMLYFTSANILILIFFTYVLFKKKVCLYRPARQSVGRSISLKLTFLAILSILIVAYQLGGEFSLNLSETYTSHGERGAGFIFLHAVIIYALLFGLYKGGASKFVYHIAFFAILFSMLLGGRSAAIVWSIILIYIAVSRLNVKIHNIFIVMFALLFLFIVASIARGTVSLEPQGVTLELLDYNQLFTLAESIKYTKVHGARFDLFLIDVFNGFLPRSVNPDKNTSTAFTREVFPSAWEMTSYTSGFYANLIFVFGYYSVLVSPVIIAFVNIVFFRSVVSCKFGLMNFIAICFGVCPVLIVRGGIFEQRMFLLVFLIIFGWALWRVIGTRLSANKINTE